MRARARALFALVALGCSSEAAPDPAPVDVEPAPPPVVEDPPRPPPSPPAPIPAFLVYGPESTTLVPVDAGMPPRTAAGHFLASLEAPREVVHRVVPASGPAVGIPACACGTIEGACLGSAVLRTIHVGDRVEVESSGCPCWSTPESTAWPRRPRYPVDPNGESLGPCDEVRGPLPVVSIVGGRIYTQTWGSSIDEPCARDAESLNVYDTYGEELALVGPALARLPDEHGPRRCSASEGWTWSPRMGGRACRDDDDAMEEGDPCHPDFVDFEYPSLALGLWCRIERGVSAVGEQSTCATCVDASPTHCPSALDPCGDPSAFREAVDGATLYWIATDGRAALVIRGREASLHAPAAAPRAVALGALGARDIVGVLFHPDAGGILGAMAHDASIAEPAPPRACRDDDACRDGRVCTNGACHPRCSSDADCDRSGQCGARCRDSRCGPVPDGRCDEDAPCEEGFACVGGACVEPDAAPESDTEGAACAADAECSAYEGCDGGRCARLSCDASAEPRAAADACSRARRAAEPTALRACRCALQVAIEDRVRAAIEYELGRIAEDAGDAAGAQDHYERSLVLRPNDAVRARLEGLDH